MKLLIIGALAVFFAAAITAEKARFDFYKVYTLKITNEEQLEFLKNLEDSNSAYVFWTSPTTSKDVEIMVPPHKGPDFDDLVKYLKIESVLTIENVQQLFDEESPKRQSRAFDWLSYNTYDEINAWLDGRVAAYPGLLSNIIIGQSVEGRPMRIVQLSARANNPIIFVEANIHAREWITSATVTWLLNELLTSTDPVVRDIATVYDWQFLTVANPDGFVFSHTSNRLWRKNRSAGNILCRGTDPNRNFDWYWMRGGASNSQCAETFAGTEAFSEPETRAIRDHYAGIASRTVFYMSVHSFGQYLLLPYGHDTNPSGNHGNLMDIAQTTVNALRARFGTDYVFGSTASTLYVATGGSADWATGIYHTPLSYTFELRDIRNGPHGFTLPPDQILPNCWEFLDGLKALITRARQLGQM